MRFQGQVIEWRDAQGFGFIRTNGSDDRIFLHIKDFATGKRKPSLGIQVTFELAKDDRGRPRAERVRYAKRISLAPKSERSGFPWISPLFLCGLLLAGVFGRVPLGLSGVYLLVSSFTFLAYWSDKSAAKSGRWRTPESTLHLFSLAGGWPGAIVAQHLLRHKSVKQPFRTMYWVTVVLNIGVLLWIITSPGAHDLRNILGGR